ncbi:MAG TPA: HAMP domain-containing sensor histidine kinase, partial [Candidatus Dormibacteraeota bacterium]|nr:HAMP domain-containing sensor histidine kinase [Candidatus Dormibacteraeota bacterium]
ASDLIFHLHFPVGVQIFIAAATAVASLSFASIKSFFDRVTNKLFFRDSYDTQVFFDEFNQTLVATYELDQLLKESVKIIEQNIKPAHCQFVINKTANTEGRIMGTANKPALTEDDLQAIKEAIGKTHSKLIVADELEARHEALQKQLRTKDIVLAATLSSSSSGSKTEVGYFLLGPKKSGNLYSSQDVKVLEIVANELAIAIQNALRFEEIQNFNITLQGKVEEATRKLRRANEKLKTLDETKDDFISMASHQLRTPLTSVKGYISMVLEGDAGKITPKQQEMLGQAFFSSQRMVYLIADLLNISRLKTGKFIIEPSRVNLADVVEQELGQLKETAASRSLKLSYDKPEGFPDLMLDETKTRQVIMNFVDNAIYYTPTGGHITVRLVNNPTTIELRVEDDGIGVPKSEQPHLFTKFYRAGNARKARPDGTGLGLFMAKKVVVAQGGSIVFESQEGSGSTFGFVFSKHQLAAPAPAEAPR